MRFLLLEGKRGEGALTEMKFLMVKSSVRDDDTFWSWPLSCARRDIISSSAEFRMASVLTVYEDGVRITEGDRTVHYKVRDLPVIDLVWPIRWTRYFLFEQIVNKKTPKFLCHISIIIITLTACASTSAFQTGSQNMTRDAEIKFLPRCSGQKRDASNGRESTHKPREPCFNSMRNTLYLSDVSNVVRYCWRMCTGEAVVY